MLNKLRQYTRDQRLRRFNEFMQGATGRVRLIDLGGHRPILGELGPGEAAAAGRHARQQPRPGQEPRERSHIVAEHPPPARRRVDADGRGPGAVRRDFLEQPDRTPAEPAGTATTRPGNHRLGPHVFPADAEQALAGRSAFPQAVCAVLRGLPAGAAGAAAQLVVIGIGLGGAELPAALARLANYYPLTTRDVRELFPQARVIVERPLGVPMSIIARSAAGA